MKHEFLEWLHGQRIFRHTGSHFVLRSAMGRYLGAVRTNVMTEVELKTVRNVAAQAHDLFPETIRIYEARHFRGGDKEIKLST
jgi:hypothetical protein